MLGPQLAGHVAVGPSLTRCNVLHLRLDKLGLRPGCQCSRASYLTILGEAGKPSMQCKLTDRYPKGPPARECAP